MTTAGTEVQNPVYRATIKQSVRRILVRLVDVFGLPFIFLSACVLKLVRRLGVASMPLAKRTMLAVGVFPIQNHYYEPLFDHRRLRHDLSKPRQLNGIDWNIEGQLRLMRELDSYAPEIHAWRNNGNRIFGSKNSNFDGGDANYWYALIRKVKPRRIIEVGSGFSTMIAKSALDKNADEGAKCEHLCIEPYEMPWLESTGVKVVRKCIEDVDQDIFASLEANDIVFIDSSHVIRPQGDVLIEVLEIVPLLKSGVIVHFHDIFSPRDYPSRWVVNDVRMWNEQYLVEALLTHNQEWEILGALNMLQHDHSMLIGSDQLLTPNYEPGSLYIRKR